MAPNLYKKLIISFCSVLLLTTLTANSSEKTSNYTNKTDIGIINSKTKGIINNNTKEWAKNNNVKDINTTILMSKKLTHLELKHCNDEINVKNKSQHNIWGNLYFTASCNNPKWTVTYRTNVTATAYLPALKHSLHKGDIIEKNNIFYKWIHLKINESNLITQDKNIIDKQVARFISANTGINRHLVAEKYIIRAGDIVTVEAGNSDFKVTLKGEALSSSSLNNIVKVKILNSNKVVFARPLSSHTVLVDI